MNKTSLSLLPENFTTFIDTLWDGVYIVDRKGHIIYWNKAAEEITGYEMNSVIGRSCGKELLSHHCGSTILCDVACPLVQTAFDGVIREVQVSLVRKDGKSIPVILRTLPYHDTAGKIIGVIEIFRKLIGTDEMAKLLQERNELAFVEPLTKAARRNYGENVLEKALAAFSSSMGMFGVLLIDIDNFKTVNDQFGHSAGDSVLEQAADLIRQYLRPSDLLVRWGGDEFLIIAASDSQADLLALGTKLCTLVAEHTFSYNDAQLLITFSIGGALPVEGDTIKSIVERADRSMYLGKQQGKNRCTISP